MTRTSINDSLFGSDPSGVANILDNGGFEIWQRGTTFSNPASGIYTADRWRVDKNGNVTVPQMDVSQNSANVDNGQFSIDMNITNIGAGSVGNVYCSLVQFIENYQAYGSKTVSCTMRVKTTLSGVHIELYDGSSVTSSNSHSGGGAFETLSVTKTMQATPTSFRIYIGFPSQQPTGTGHIYVDSAMLTVGAQPVSAFIPLHPQVDLARCQRYYELASQMEWFIYDGVGSTNYGFNVHFAVPKRVTPTVTFSGGTTVKVSSTAVNGQATDGFNFNIITTAGAGKSVVGNGASGDATWTASADL